MDRFQSGGCGHDKNKTSRLQYDDDTRSTCFRRRKGRANWAIKCYDKQSAKLVMTGEKLC